MLTEDQLVQFDTFGFVVLRGILSTPWPKIGHGVYPERS